ncbi:TA system antitoxin ParD family protein [Solemya elarraichensis gill symbiont]|uniref:ParD-like antitoxin of type II toxin-antitoxin system n=1 Tax=Solemya elarraichensis gill symbiont TaxID=1918949 RepID=A0A1T2L1M7_9GAMM|nr:hypothetical protein [Solemya elarraichensis gill symbiont]OOZ38920.1 hypothetical protein BOW52_07865 [Solemya elarraichensis gill symbiont]
MGSNLRLDGELIAEAKITGAVMSRSAAKQIEHWAKIGRIMEDNPDLNYAFVRDALLSKAEADAGMTEEYTFG